MPFARVVEATCRRWRMFTPGTGALVAVSGGPDSVALLLALHELAPRLEITLAVAHLNHGIRGAAADRDQAFVESLARRLSLSFHTAGRDTPGYATEHGMSIEEAARTLRYEFLRETAAREGCAAIAVGHTEDDQAETVLMALLRGSGLTGLGGMPPVLGGVVRPLIESSRQDVLDYLEQLGEEYRLDETNDDTAYTRNRVRHVVLPLLEREFNPNIRSTLARNALLIQDEDAWLGGLTREFMAEACLPSDSSEIILDREKLAGAPIALQRRALREAIARVGGGSKPPLQQFGSANVEDLVDLLSAGRTGARLDLPGGIWAELGYRRLVLAQGGRPRVGGRLRFAGADYELQVPGSLAASEPVGWEISARVLDVAAGATVDGGRWPGWQVHPRDEATEFAAFLDVDELVMPLRMRTRRRGDRFWPHGAPGERKLKDFLIDSKVPRAMRDRLPLLCDSSGRICAVLPLRAACWAIVKPSTQRVLALTGRIVTGPGVDREHPAW